VRLLIDKVSEMNYKARDSSMAMLMTIFRHPSVPISVAIEGVMDITEKQPGPAKVMWRVASARLEILQSILKEFGINEKVWNWLIVY